MASLHELYNQNCTQDIPPNAAPKQFLRHNFRISNFKSYVTTPLSAEFNFRSFELSNVKNRSVKDMSLRIQFFSPVLTSSARMVLKTGWILKRICRLFYLFFLFFFGEWPTRHLWYQRWFCVRLKFSIWSLIDLDLGSDFDWWREDLNTPNNSPRLIDTAVTCNNWGGREELP